MKIAVEIQGVTPMILNRFHEAAQQSASRGSSSSIRSGDSDSPKEQCELKLYYSQSAPGVPILPGPNLLRCFIDAGTFFKMGKSKVTTAQSSLVPACLAIDEIEVPIFSKDGWTVDERPVRNPATGGRFLCYRPRFDDWKMSFTAELDETLMSPKLFRELVDAAGKRIGIGDFRPARKGPFGRFVVTNWAVV